jgi:Putative DNA-binding domain
MLDGRPLSEQSYPDLKAFLEQQVGEGLTLDYKRELTDSSRSWAELCRDVSALANSQGGTIVYGVDEEGLDRTPVLPPHGTAPGSPTRQSRSGRPRCSETVFSNLVVVVSELVCYVVGPLELAKGKGGRHEQV